MFVFLLMSDELMLVNGDCELNFSPFFLAFWLCDSEFVTLFIII